ncbi:hypothetical protein TNIN_254061 [Trichonephila inaurata madagascariensis]|uniref:Transposase n=1 Tax=Trichonephila inaurata madagascariensis TaxID=2747483 RepID=A0A8X6XD57_9ARAC|nr:hypothetical protein TNIN_254061 [Trichonephila inaurata madagascariensis]
MVLLHNACTHSSRVTHVEVVKFKWEQLDAPPYSPGMSPCDFHLFVYPENFTRVALTQTMNSRTLRMTGSRHGQRDSANNESFGSPINGIVVLRPMVYSLN